MSNHIEEAKKILADADSMDPREDWAQRYFNAVQAKALIAIAEQLRIANLIALNQEARVNNPSARSLYQVDDSQFGSMVKGLQPDIAEALGIGGESND